jgi:NAD(P)H-nitrite reductase large subunit/Fe-S-cluster-containing hydrogenase component 2
MSEKLRRLAFVAERCLACRGCELACSLAHAGDAGPPPRRRVRLARAVSGALAAERCEQCEEPLCAFACKSGALRLLVGGGLVFDEERCVGCGMCLMVCPTGVHPDPARDRVVRCDLCRDRTAPACVAACPTRALAVEVVVPPAPTSDFGGRLLVVGSSAAGIAGCEAARRHAPRACITLCTADEDPCYSRPLLPYRLGGRRSALGWRTCAELDRLGVELRTGSRAAALELEARRVLLADGGALEFDRLLIATGARPTLPRLPGVELAGVHGLRELADLERIEDAARSARSALVLGGGNVGLQVCEALLERGLAVSVVVGSPHLLSQMVDAEAGRRVGELFARHGLVLRTGRDLRALGGSAAVEWAELDDGERIAAQLVVIGKGIRPNVEWLTASGLRLERGVVVDACGRTSAPGVYAAGDCAESIDPLTGGLAVSGVWPVAYEMGWSAGSTAVGVPRPCPGALRLNASRFFGVPIVSLGEVRGERLEGARELVLEAGARVYRKLVVRGERLVGALLYGATAGAGRCYRLYRDGGRLGAAELRELALAGRRAA